MISRVAEHCYWLSRYLERAENTARVLEVNQTLLLDFEVPLEQQWKPILIISGIHEFAKPMEAETVQQHMTWDRDNPCSIASSIAHARENARIIREVISADMWERMNFYYLWMQGEVARELYETDRTEFYSQIKRINQLVFGIGEGTMSHGEPWDFYLLGHYLERACQTGRILDVKYHILLPSPEHVGTAVDNAHWMAILKSCSGYEPYHKHRRGVDKGASVADFLIFDPIFPRSIRRCLEYCQEAYCRIAVKRELSREVGGLLDELVTFINSATLDTFIRRGLHEVLTKIVDTIHDIGNAIRRNFFEVPLERLTQEQWQQNS